MSFRTSTTGAILCVLLLGALSPAIAQPIVPQRPTYGSYYNLFRPGGGNYYFGNGYASPNFQLQLQNQLLQQQLNSNNQSIASLQTYLAGGVNPNLPITGRGATYNDLGHWYPQSRNGGGGGAVMGAGTLLPRGPGMMPGAGMGSGAGVGGMPGGGSGTAGSGIPLARPGVGNPTPRP